VTEISFHFNVANKTDYAAGLLRTVLKRQLRALVVGDSANLTELSQQLWCRSPESFLPHCFGTAPSAVLVRTPVVLAEQGTGDWGDFSVLINLMSTVPPGFERHGRMLELVTTLAQDRLDARERWKYYANRGYVITKTDVTGKNAAH
jgi:DNA polymerase III subunit chi